MEAAAAAAKAMDSMTLEESQSKAEEEDISQDNPELRSSAVFSNELILSRILSFLPASTLKECRLVNSTWNDEAIRPYFNFPRGALQFTLNTDLGEDFPQKLKLMQQFQIKAFKIDLSSTPILTPEQCTNPLTVEAISQIESLLEKYGPKLEYLHLKMDLSQPSTTVPMVVSIFKKLSTLQEIVLDLGIREALFKYGLRFIPPLLNVRSLKIQPNCFSVLETKTTRILASNIVAIMRIFHNVKSISLQQSYQVTLEVLFHFSNDSCWHNLSNLRELNLHIEGGATGSDVLTRLSWLTNGLEVLTLQIKGCSSARDTYRMRWGLQDVFERHGPTLRSLEMKIQISYMSEVEKFKFNFPSCPKLQVFKLSINEDLRLVFNFPTEHISYKKDFPKMEELYIEIFPKIVPKNPDAILPEPGIPDPESTSFYELGCSLFGDGDVELEKCLTMKLAEFVIPENWMTPNNLEWGQRIVKQFQTTFPNARLMSMEKMINWVNDV